MALRHGRETTTAGRAVTRPVTGAAGFLRISARNAERPLRGMKHPALATNRNLNEEPPMPSIRPPKTKTTTRATATSVSLIAMILAAGLPAGLAAQTGALAPLPADEAAIIETPPEIMNEVADTFIAINDRAEAQSEKYRVCMDAAALSASSSMVTAEMQRSADATAGAGGSQVLNESMCQLDFYEEVVAILGEAANNHLRAQQGLEASLAGFTEERATHEAARAAADGLIAETMGLREALVVDFADEFRRILAIPEEERTDADKAAIANFEIDLQLVQLDLEKGASLRAIAAAELERLGAAEALVSRWATQSGLTARRLTVDIRMATNSIEIIKAGASAEARRQATQAMLAIVQRADLSGSPFPDMPQVTFEPPEGGGFGDIAAPQLGGGSEIDLLAVFAEYGIDVTPTDVAQAEGGQ